MLLLITSSAFFPFFMQMIQHSCFFPKPTLSLAPPLFKPRLLNFNLDSKSTSLPWLYQYAKLILQDRSHALSCPLHIYGPMEKIEEELVSGIFIIPGNKFVKFTNKFKYLGTYIAQDLSDDTNIDESILTASKNFNGQRHF